MIVNARYVFLQLAITIKWKWKRKEEFGVRLGKLSGRRDYRKVFCVRIEELGLCPFSQEFVLPWESNP